MRVLLVGAGAVGQVYGRHLRDGGADVAFYVKDKYADDARRGFVLYPLNDKKARSNPVHFTDFEVLTSMEAVGEHDWDYVILCVSSTALKAGTWIDELAAVVGNATVVTLQVGLEDHAFLVERFATEQIATGLIGIASYLAPMPGEQLPEPGVAYWLPPFMRCPFSGERARVDPLVAMFKRGKFPAKRHPDAQRAAAFGSALLQTQVCALELVGWSIVALRRDKQLRRTAHRAMREATAVAAHSRGARAPLMQRRLLRPAHLGMLLSLSAWLAPMDFERFFEVHYTKVRDQSMAMLSTWIRIAQDNDLDNVALRELRTRLEEKHAAETAA